MCKTSAQLSTIFVTMKVICIDSCNPIDREKVSFEDYLIEGNTYTVLGSYKAIGKTFYNLKERPRKLNGKRIGYWSKRFLPKKALDEAMWAKLEE